MNRLKRIALLGLVLFGASIMLSAATKSPLFTKSVVITQIFPHKLGYRIIYMSNDLALREVYLPIELFKVDKGSKIFYGLDQSFPYMQIVWEDGDFSHVKLYLKEEYNDITWGALTTPSDYDQHFSVTDIKFDF